MQPIILDKTTEQVHRMRRRSYDGKQEKKRAAARLCWFVFIGTAPAKKMHQQVGGYY